VSPRILWLGLLGLGLGAAPGRAQSFPDNRPVVMLPGDSLRVVVLRVPEVSGSFQIASDSSLVYPVYQGIKVVGIPMAMVRERIRPVLVPYQREPEFSVQPLLRVSVGGEVRLPRVYFLPPEMTIGAAVDAAGGPSDRGNLGKVRLVRAGRETTFNLADASGAAELVTVRSGDRIIVSKRSNVLGWLGPVASITAIAAGIVVIVRRN
jgi:protein involved in polysaccharide export with SLBB domain